MKIYLDIETIPTQNPEFQNYVSDNLKPPANYKKADAIEQWLAENREEAINKTALDGAFGEIVVIGVAVNDEPVKLFYEPNWQKDGREKDLLTQFFSYLKEQGLKTTTLPEFIGHNIAGFDSKFIFQRAVINGIQPTFILDRRNTFDTMLEWNAYDRKSYVSLDKLCKVLNIEQKGEIDGSKVWEYVQSGKIDEVAEYCAKDVERVRQVYKRINFME